VIGNCDGNARRAVLSLTKRRAVDYCRVAGALCFR
jgi:hypothetical protein